MGRPAIAERRDPGHAVRMRHPELLPAICMGIAVEMAHLRWIVLSQWKCKCCGENHLNCRTKPIWLKIFL